MNNSSAAEIYVVKTNDTLTDVLFGLNLKPVYGNNGSLKKILELNPILKKRNGNFIIPGQSIGLDELLGNNSRSVSSTLTPPLESPLPPQKPTVNEDTKSTTGESYLSLSIDKSQKEINGFDQNGTNGNLHSSKASELNLEWSPRYSNFHWIEFGYVQSSVEFNDSSKRNLLGKSQSTEGFYLTSHHEWSDRFSSDLRIGSQEQILYRATSLTEIKIEKIPLYYSQVSLLYNLAKLNKIAYALSIDGRVHLPNSNDYYSIKTSFGHTINFLASHEMKKVTLFANGHYSKDSLDAKEIEFTTESVGISLGIKIRIGD